MIVTESMLINDCEFIRTYSDGGYLVERDGVKYCEAMDPAGMNHEYTETQERIRYGVSDTEEKAIAHDILMGVLK